MRAAVEGQVGALTVQNIELQVQLRLTQQRLAEALAEIEKLKLAAASA